jgi:hypothetical protein
LLFIHFYLRYQLRTGREGAMLAGTKKFGRRMAADIITANVR